MKIGLRINGKKSMGHSEQQGMSLIELMIALLLGSVIIAGAVKILISSGQSLRLQESVSSAQENGRLALEIMLADLRRAGVGTPSASIASGGGAQVEVTGQDGVTTTAAATGLLTASDNVQIAYVATEVGTDCEGHAANVGDTIINRYFIQNDSNPTIAALFCSGAVVTSAGVQTGTPSGLALVRGVESFQVLYGQGASSNPGNGYSSPVRYITGRTGAGANIDVVSSIRVALLVRSESGIGGLPATTNDFPVLDTTISAATLAGVKDSTDRFYIHRYFSGTAALRNAAGGLL